MEIKVTNVNQAISEALIMMADYGELEQTRNGPALVMPEPVLTIYREPRERVLFWPARDANPFFHLMESLWMLAGRNDVEWIGRFNSTFKQFSDDGATFHGAYGHRWRSWFGIDQLEMIATQLRTNPTSRRAVLAMWDAQGKWTEFTQFMNDLEYAMVAGSKDVPCNTHAYFEIKNHCLNLTVCCRSNDLWLGCYGANAVHFSMLLEIMAAWVGVETGRLQQFSSNLHLYANYRNLSLNDDRKEISRNLKTMAYEAETYDGYASIEGIQPMPLTDCHKPNEAHWWFQDLEQFMRNPVPLAGFTWRCDWFRDVAVPVYEAWTQRKNSRIALGIARSIQSTDWRKACVEWLKRREDVRAQRTDTAASA